MCMWYNVVDYGRLWYGAAYRFVQTHKTGGRKLTHAKGPATLWEKRFGPFLIRERQARFRKKGEGYEVRFVFGMETNVRLRSFGEREAAEAWIAKVLAKTIASRPLRTSKVAS